MRKAILILAISLLLSCGVDQQVELREKYIVETTVQLKEGKTNEVLELFKASNPGLVKNQPDWLRATFSVIEDEDKVIVRAEWRKKESYVKFSNSEKFQETMGQFREHFMDKPNVTISKVLFEM